MEQPSIKSLAIVGAGGLGKEMAAMLRQINTTQPVWNIVGFYDDFKPLGSCIAGLKVLGRIDDLNRINHKLAVVVAIGDPLVKKKVVDQLINPSIFFPSLIHPLASLGDNINMGKGCIIAAGCRLTIDISLGDFVLLNLNTTVGHDVSVGSYTSVMPGVHLSGYVRVGECVLVGTGASILQEITIDHGAIIGAGAVVNKNVGPATTVIGVPARKLKKDA